MFGTTLEPEAKEKLVIMILFLLNSPDYFVHHGFLQKLQYFKYGTEI